MRFRMFRELKLMVLGLFSGLRALGHVPEGPLLPKAVQLENFQIFRV